MLKLRVQGLPREVDSFASALERSGMVLERSEPYDNRGASRYVRVYLEVEVPSSSSEIAKPNKRLLN